MADYQFLWEEDGLFDRLPFPVVLADNQFRLLYCNKEAIHQFPFLGMADGIITLLSPNRPDAILALMEDENCISMASTVVSGDHIIHVLSMDGLCPPNRLLMITTGCMHRALLSPGLTDSVMQVTSAFRTYLSVCFSSLDILNKSGVESEQLFLIRQSCMKMMRDLANITALSSNKSNLRPRLLYGNLTAYAQGLFGAAAKLLRENGYHVHLDLPKEAILTSFDAKELSTALLNLLANAGKFGAHKIEISLKRQKSFACFCITDDGEGLPSLSNNLFVPYQYEYGPKSGIGLGLAIVKLVANHHGGTTIASSDAAGTRFLLNIPIRQLNTHPIRHPSEEDYLRNRFSSVYVGLAEIVSRLYSSDLP